MRWEQLLCPGRERPSTSTAKADLRSEFEKDYHRIIGSASFRRLQDKTQVFPLDQSDFVRTRLTHSLEVSSFAQSLGQNISEKILTGHLDDDFRPAFREDICNILKCAGLIHDIGNPPFGHFGEIAIRNWFKNNLEHLTCQGKRVGDLLLPQMKEDFYRFEGNAQALRLVTKLHYLLDEHGMNLTYGLLSSIIKYPASSLEADPDSGDIRKKKMGYYYADRDLYARIQKATGTNGSRNPLTFILEAADDIAYRTVDIEDGFVKGFISYEQLYDALSGLDEIVSGENRMKPAAVLAELFDKGIEEGVSMPEEYAVKNWIVRAQNILISCATESFADRYREIMDGVCSRDLFAGSPGEELAEVLGRTADELVFSSRAIFCMEQMETVMINFLLGQFVRAAIEIDPEDGDERQQVLRQVPFISDNYVRAYLRWSDGCDEAEKLYLRIMLVTDYVCGMTDSYAKRVYQQFNGMI